MSNGKFGFDLNEYTTDSVIHAPYIEANMTDSLVVTMFPTVSATSKRVEKVSWNDLCKKVEQAKVFADKSAQPLIKLSSFGDVKSASGSLRHDENVLEVYGVEIDYDCVTDTPITFDDAVSRLEKAGLEALVHTSFNHDPEKGKHKWRVLLPLSAPVKPAERVKYVEQINNLFDGDIDQGASFGTSHSFYFGSNGKNYQVKRVAGGRIDIAGKNLKRLARADKKAEVQVGVTQGNSYYQNIIDGVELHHSLLKYSCSLIGRGLKSGEAINILQSLMYQCRGKRSEQDWSDRFNAIPELVNSAYDAIGIRPEDNEWRDTPLGSVSLAGISTREIPPHPFVIPLWVPMRAVTLLASDGGVGKSFISLQMAISVALGWSFLGEQGEPRPVVYISGEDGADTVLYRAQKFLRGRDYDESLLIANLHILDWSKEVQPAIFNRRENSKSASLDPAQKSRLTEYLAGINPVMIVGDNDSILFAGNEIDRSEVQAFASGLRQIHSEAAWVMLHHIDKMSANNKKLNAYSGSTGWNNAARMRLAIGWEDGKLVIGSLKSNYCKVGMRANVVFNSGSGFFDIGEVYEVTNHATEDLRIQVAEVIQLAESEGKPITAGESGKHTRVTQILTRLNLVNDDRNKILIRSALNTLIKTGWVVAKAHRVDSKTSERLFLSEQGIGFLSEALADMEAE